MNSYYTLAISYCTFCVGKHTILGPGLLGRHKSVRCPLFHGYSTFDRMPQPWQRPPHAPRRTLHVTWPQPANDTCRLSRRHTVQKSPPLSPCQTKTLCCFSGRRRPVDHC